MRTLRRCLVGRGTLRAIKPMSGIGKIAIKKTVHGLPVVDGELVLLGMDERIDMAVL